MNTESRLVSELVPLAARIRNLQWFRGAVATMVVIFTITSEAVTAPGRQGLVTVAMAYVAVALVAEAYWRLSKQRGLSVFGLLLIVDGLFLGWVTFETGISLSPFRYLILVHAGAVALLASYRTGMKAALSHSLLLLVIHHAHAAGLMTPLSDPAAGQESSFERLVALVVALWFMTVATASFSAVNERELRRRRYDLEALTSLAGELDRVTGAGDVAETLLRHLHDAFDFRRGIVIAAQQGPPRLLAAHAQDRGTAANVTESDVIASACEQHRPLLIRRLDLEREAQLAALLPDACNLVVCPLLAEGRVFGAVIVEQPPRRVRIERRVVTMTERFCSHAALALQNAWLVERLHAIAATDGLTGLANRRTFDTTLQQELSRSADAGSSLTLVMVDIDHFKALNDTHGHQTGDDVLGEVATVLRNSCREFDVAARYGGEEFAVILPDTEPHTALTVAERLRRAVATADTSAPVTVSVGVATAAAGLANADALIAAADNAMYESKRTGRNRVTAAPNPVMPAMLAATAPDQPRITASGVA